MKTVRQVLLAAVALALAGDVFGADAVSCVRASDHPLVTWRSNSADPVRIYFKASNAKAESYVEAVRTGAITWALLPKPAATTETIAVRIATLSDGKVVEHSRQTLKVHEACAAQTLTPEQQRAASSIVVGATAESTIVPIGFVCDGIAANISASGVMTARNACSELAAQMAQTGESASTETKTRQSGDETGVTSHVARPPRRGPVSSPPITPRRPRPVSPSTP